MTPPAFLLASDLDGTLLPAEGGRLGAAAAEFSSLFAKRTRTALAYVTGRHLKLALKGLEESGLPEPDFLACDVGTTLYRRENGIYVQDGLYAAEVRQAFGDLDTFGVRRIVFDNIPEVKLQEEDKQGEFKMSFYLSSNAPDGLIPNLDAALRNAGAHTSVVFSLDPVDGRGLLDILPRGISKLSPIRQIAAELGVTKEDVVYAGDSGNDEAALLGGFRGILVGNAPRDLRARLRKLADERGLTDCIYFARAEYAAGVLEGCRKYGLI